METFDSGGTRGNFSNLSLGTGLEEALPSMGINWPNALQLKVIPEIMKSKGLMFASETGSGKTLAYLLPVIKKLKLEEAEEGKILNDLRMDGKPRSLVLVPSNELINQVFRVAKHIAHYEKVKVEKISGTLEKARRIDATKGPIDMAISTPAQILSMDLSNCSHLVLDEGDTLLSDDFGLQVQEILKKTPCLKTLIICSATIPISLTRFLDRHFPEITKLTSSALHKVSSRVDVRFIEANKPGNYKPVNS
jgi:ATP-dependent RNA helicase MRH4